MYSSSFPSYRVSSAASTVSQMTAPMTQASMRLSTTSSVSSMSMTQSNIPGGKRLRVVVRVRPFLRSDNHPLWPSPRPEDNAFFSPDDCQLIVRLPTATDAMIQHMNQTLQSSLGTGGPAATVQSAQDFVSAIQRKMRLPKQFTFDHVFDDVTRLDSAQQQQAHAAGMQQQFFESCGVIPLLESVMNGYSACVLSVGQTGSGKTFTMSGASHDASLNAAAAANMAAGASMRDQVDSNDGLLPRTLQWIFDRLREQPHQKSTVSVSFVELYNEQMFDMLSVALAPDAQQQSELKLRWIPQGGANGSGVFALTGQVQVPIESVTEAVVLFREASKHRHVRQHQKNRESSRSHAIFIVEVARQAAEKTSVGSIYLCDLAGSENLKQSQSHVTADPLHDILNNANSSAESNGGNPLVILHSDDMAAKVVRNRSQKRQQQSETGNINRSLMTLGQCIALLAAQSNNESSNAASIFLPLRNSKLTKLLSSTLTGQSLALIVCCVAPWSWSTGLNDSVLMSSAGLLFA